MTSFCRQRNTFMTNPNGILDSVMSFGLQNRIKSNVRLYFYKYNLYDLVEIELHNDLLSVFDFKHTEDRAIEIRDLLEFYVGYFKSAGLEGKRFLFDLSNKLPVTYEDFTEMNDIPYIEGREFAFTLDKRSGYIAEKSAVSIFVASERTELIDKCVLSYMNNSIKIINNRNFELAGCCSAIIISGLLSGLQFKGIEDQIELIDADTKFIGSTRDVSFSSKFVNDVKAKLKVDKFKRILEKASVDIIIQGEIVEKQNLKGEVSLRDIIDQGLDKFMKAIKNPKEVVRVSIDTEYQTIRSAYIVAGIMCITPVTLMPISHFKELLNSDNVEYILN